MIAEKLNISQSSYSQLENGKRALILSEAYIICRIYDKRMFELFPNHQIEISKSELFWVQKHEASFALSAFNSEKRLLTKQNKQLSTLLQSTLALYDSVARVLGEKNRKG